MASNDKETLLERVREGFDVNFDPPGNGMCFYAATGHQLSMSANTVHNLIFNHLHQHGYEVCVWFHLIFTNISRNKCMLGYSSSKNRN